MIKQYMVDVEPCHRCGGLAYLSDVHIFHVDNPSEGEGFLWAYQEKSQDTIEVQYRCGCGTFSDRLQVFCDHNGDLYISPLQTFFDKAGVIKPPTKQAL